MELFEETKKLYNKSLIESKLVPSKHLIFMKYTAENYYRYAIDVLEFLCKRSKYENIKYLFHISLYYLLNILYGCGNTPYLDNYDLMILTSFYIGVKISENQHSSPSLNKIKHIYPEKFSQYKNEEIKKFEVICLKLLNYNINILTSYECLFYILKNNNEMKLIEASTQELDNLIFNEVRKILFKRPLDIAKESIEKVKQKLKNRSPILGTKKLVPITSVRNRDFKAKIIRNIESISTNSSLGCEKVEYKYLNSIRNKSIVSNKLKYTCLASTESKKVSINSNILNTIKQQKSSAHFPLKLATSLQLLHSFNRSNSKNKNLESFNMSISNRNYNNSINYPIAEDSDNSKKNESINTKGCSRFVVFKKPTLNKKNVKTFFTANNLKPKKTFPIYQSLLTRNNANFSYGKISALYNKLNLDAFIKLNDNI